MKPISSNRWCIDVDARLPDRIGRFKILSLLGRGAMGVVYKAQDPLIERTVAIKVVRADLLAGAERDTYLARFHDEARIAALCHHNTIVGIHEFSHADREPYLVMDYVDGIPLSRAMPRGTQISLPEAVHIAAQILDALAAMHHAGVTHCDIKPANILLTRQARLKITDFGISRLAGAAPAGIPLLIGTPSYMSPEQCQGEPVDPRSDFFSLGVVLYELLTGERPFQGLAYTDTVFKLINQPHHALNALRPDLPAELGRLIDHALAKKAESRMASAADFATALGLLPPMPDLPPILFSMPAAGGFAQFAYPAPSTAADTAQESETVQWAPAASATLPDQVFAQATLPADIAPSGAMPPSRRRRPIIGKIGSSLGATWRAGSWLRRLNLGSLLPSFPGYRPQREED